MADAHGDNYTSRVSPCIVLYDNRRDKLHMYGDEFVWNAADVYVGSNWGAVYIGPLRNSTESRR